MSDILAKKHGERFLKLGQKISYEIAWTSPWMGPFRMLRYFIDVCIEKEKKKKQWHRFKAWRIRRFVLRSTYQLQERPCTLIKNCNQLCSYQGIVKAFQKTEKKGMPKPGVEQLRQHIRKHNSSQKLKNLWNAMV